MLELEPFDCFVMENVGLMMFIALVDGGEGVCDDMPVD
jgi:hypothetical protein